MELTGTSRREFSPETFHLLRVEIKRACALGDLLRFACRDFDRKETLQPLRKITRQAGRVRELQLQQQMIGELSQVQPPPSYLHSLQIHEGRERKIFFSILESLGRRRLEEVFRLMQGYVQRTSKKDCERFLSKKEKKIHRLLPGVRKEDQAHQLRKELKTQEYLLEMLSRKHGKRQKELSKILGDWHDWQVCLLLLRKELKNEAGMAEERRLLQSLEQEAWRREQVLFLEAERLANRIAR